MDSKYVTVTQLTKYIKYIVDNDVNLNTVYLKKVSEANRSPP